MTLIRTKLGNFNFWYKKGDKTIGERISLRKFERFETYLMKNLSRGVGIAVDVGANIGYYTLILSKLTDSVVSYEPERESRKMLIKNVVENGIRNVKIIGKAVSNRKELLRLGVSEDNLGDHQINPKTNHRRIEVVKSTYLDADISERVSILKIDTQGWEPKVIIGSKKLISRYQPTIFMEFWPEGYKRSSLNYSKMISFLERKYRNIYLIDDYLEMVYPIKAETLETRCRTRKGYVDLLFKKNMNFSDRWLCIKSFRIKRFIKKMFRLEIN
jgi:FkbM family methyltransferase